MIYYVYSHQHKGRPYHLALHQAGYTPKASRADVALFDRDWYIHNDQQPRREVLDQLSRDAVIMVYPHSALMPWWYDGLVPVRSYVKCIFVIGKGQKAALKTVLSHTRIEVTGWPWCRQKTFDRPKDIHTILFGPIHPAGGRLRPEAIEANRNIFYQLKRVQSSLKCKIVVRYISDLEQQGLHPYHRFEWIKGRPDGSTKEIDSADVVIGEGTFMYTSVARGKPTIGINQHLPTRANKLSDRYTPRSWDKYGASMAYPINFGDGPLIDLINLAVDTEQTTWRSKFVGDSMDRSKFAKTVNQIWLDERE